MSQSYADRVNDLQKEMCRLADKISSAHLEDQEFFNNIAIQYSNHLKKIQFDRLRTLKI